MNNKFKALISISLIGLFLSSCGSACKSPEYISDSEFWKNFSTKGIFDSRKSIGPCPTYEDNASIKEFGRVFSDVIIDKDNNISLAWSDFGNSVNRRTFNGTNSETFIERFDINGSSLIKNKKMQVVQILMEDGENILVSLQEDKKYNLALVDKDLNIVRKSKLLTEYPSKVIAYKDNYVYSIAERNINFIGAVYRENLLTGEKSEIIRFSDFSERFLKFSENKYLNVYTIKEQNSVLLIEVTKYDLDGNLIEETAVKNPIEINTGINITESQNVGMIDSYISNFSVNEIDENKSAFFLYLKPSSYTLNKGDADINLYYGIYEKNKYAGLFTKIIEGKRNDELLLDNDQVIYFSKEDIEYRQGSEKPKLKVFIQKFDKEGKILTEKIQINANPDELRLVSYKLKEIKSLNKYLLVYGYVIQTDKNINSVPVKAMEHKIVAKLLDSNFKEEKRFDF